jgi:hypothetical protein
MPTSFVGKHMKMQVPISNTSWRSTTHSPSKELKEMPYYSLFPFSLLGREK